MQTLASISLLGLVACASSPSGPPLQPHSSLGAQDYAQVSNAVGIVLDRQFAPDNGAARTAANIAQGTPPPWIAKNVQSGLWVGNLLGIHLEIDVTCKDASGNEMVCGPGVDSADTTFDVGGSLNLVLWTGSFDVQATTALSHLTTPTMQFDADAKITLGSSFNAFGVTYSCELAIDASCSVATDTATLIPVAGNAAFALTYDRTRSDTGEIGRWEFDIDASVAGHIASFTIDGIGYQLDLVTGVVTRV